MTASRFASRTSSHAAKKSSGFSATPSSDTSSYTTTLRMPLGRLARREVIAARLGSTVMATGTPATLLLRRAGVAFTLHQYEHDPRADAFGDEAAAALAVAPERMFKTLIASVDGRLACSVVPVAGRLDLKVFAAAV